MIKDFEGIWIPGEIWACRELKAIEKVFLVEIMSLHKAKGCFASNGYFAEFFSISKGRCSVIINKLLKDGYVTIENIRLSGNVAIQKRIIRPTKKISLANEEASVNYNSVEEFDNEYALDDKIKTEEHRNNNNNNEIYDFIIGYLNEKCRTSYRSTGKTNRELIDNRIKEGFCIDDFIKVIDKKQEEWTSTEMSKYLRPQTLFGDKFERYLTEAEKNYTPNYYYNNKEYDPIKFTCNSHRK
ncbi:MAG: conserved phage C-terminal domain-containing protein [Clostridium sp.]